MKAINAKTNPNRKPVAIDLMSIWVTSSEKIDWE
jgi:hypothetical protein